MNDLSKERFVFWHRDVTQSELRYVRAMFSPPNTRPGPLTLANKTVLGWTLNQYGDCVRLIFLNCQAGPDGKPDGTADYYSDTQKDAEAGTWVGIGKPLGPMRPNNSSPAFMAEERLARREHAEHWILFFERQAREEALKRQEAAEAAAKQAEAIKAAKQAEAIKAAEAAAQPAAPIMVVRPKPQPKSILDRLLRR